MPASSDDHDTTHAISRRAMLTVGAAGTGALMLGSLVPAESAAATTGGGSRTVRHLLERPPFSFTYDGRSSTSLLAEWHRDVRVQRNRDGHRDTLVTWRDPATKLEVRWTVTEYRGFPTTSWSLEFHNTGQADSGQLADVLALDLTTPSSADAWTIHSAIGSNQATTDFGPFDAALEPDTFRLFSSYGGRPTSYAEVPDTSGTFIRSGWPYFNVDFGGAGLVVGLGWTGQWATQIARNGSHELHLQAGMCHRDSANDGDRIETLQLTDLWLRPDESIKTPTVVLQPWRRGTWIDAQNTWRRWMLAYHLPRDRGTAPTPQLSGTEYNFNATAADHLRWLDAYAAHQQTLATGGRYDHYWIDAGWYESAPGTPSGWEIVGTWEPNSERFPDGLKPVVDRARELGMSMILWFEPERVRPDTWLADNHPAWLLQPPPGYVDYLGGDEDRLLNFGDPDARHWAIEHFNGLLQISGVSRGYRDIAPFYREDFNIEPLAFWNHADPPGRAGITQAHYVAGHLEFWRSIRDRNPRMMIDTCASGGRRLDLDALALAVPLLRSDLVAPPVTPQSQTYGLALWLPAFGNQSPGNSDPADGYTQRGAMAPLWDLPVNVDDPAADWAGLADIIPEWQAIAGLYYGDYYPLTPYSTDADVWIAWQFNDRSAGGGFVQAFRRSDAPGDTQQLRLHDLDRGRKYRLDIYRGTKQVWSASAGFSDVQGQNQWRYQECAVGTDNFVDDATYLSGAWFGSNGTSGNYIAASSCHPDNSYDAVRTWVAPADGQISITGSVYKQETGGGNGVTASVVHNSAVIWTEQIAFDDTTGYSTDGALAAIRVSAGDAIRFVVSADGEYSYDGTIWNPTITMASDADFTPVRLTMTGRQLEDDGVEVALAQASAATVVYEKA